MAVISRVQDALGVVNQEVALPTDKTYLKAWEILGVKWLESPSNSFLAKALLPTGWSAVEFNDETVIYDEAGQTKVKMLIDSAMKTANVTFLKEKEVFTPVSYQNYKMYCSYQRIVEAIEHWGKVEAIMMADNGINHAFLVRFKSPIFQNKKGLHVFLGSCNHILETPFLIRGLYDKTCSSLDNVVFSNDLMLIDIAGLKFGEFDAECIWDAGKLLPDPKLSAIDKKLEWVKRVKPIESTYTDLEKSERLLEWIKQSGILMLKKGVDITGNISRKTCTANEFVKNYIWGWNQIKI